MRYWEGKEKSYAMLKERGTIQEEHIIPDLGPNVFFLNCFNDLGSCRLNGMSVGQIPLTAIWQYADRYNLSEFFTEVIRRLDVLYLRQREKEDGSKNAKKGINNRTKGRR